MTNRRMVLTALIILLSATYAYADEVRYDGDFWGQRNRATKELIVSAVFWGAEAGQDRVFAEVILYRAGKSMKVECANAVSDVLKTLQAERKAIRTGQVVDQMDKFYSDPKNKSLRLKWAFLVALEKVKGTPDEEIRQLIEEIRKKAG